MTCHITLLTSTHHTALTKTFSGPNLRVQPFKIGKDFTVSEEPVSDLQSLSELLQRLENEPTQTIIRGSLIEGKTNIVSRNKETFFATAPQWCMIALAARASGIARSKMSNRTYLARSTIRSKMI